MLRLQFLILSSDFISYTEHISVFADCVASAFYRKGGIGLILVTKDESFKLRELYPDVSIYRTLKQRSNRGKYYAEETLRVMDFVEKYRKSNVVEHYEFHHEGNEHD